jgi:hypothetical protein
MSSNSAERRRSTRLRIQVPVFVRGVDVYGEEFLDLCRTLAISAVGACLVLPRAVRANDVLQLTIPAPPPSSSGLIPAETPPMQARVKNLQPAGDVHVVGVEFLRPLD